MLNCIFCYCKKRVYPLVEVDLFKKFTEEPNEGGPKGIHGISKERPAKITLICEETDWDNVMVDYEGGSKQFYIVEAIDKEDVGKLHVQADGSAKFYYSPEQNGAQVLLDRLFDLLDNLCIVTLRLWDPKRSIQDMCNFEKAFKAETVRIVKPTVSKEELDFIKEKFTSIEFMIMEAVMPDECKLFPMNYKHAVYTKKVELKLEDLENMKCEHLTIYEGSFGSNDMNKFLKSWMAKKVPDSLKCFQILKFEKTDVLYMDLDIKKWSSRARGRDFKLIENISVDCSKDWDIERGDGRLGSVASTPGMFSFVVWHERHPKIGSDCAVMFRRGDFPRGQ